MRIIHAKVQNEKLSSFELPVQLGLIIHSKRLIEVKKFAISVYCLSVCYVCILSLSLLCMYVVSQFRFICM